MSTTTTDESAEGGFVDVPPAQAPACPNGKAILAYALQLGVKNPELQYHGLYGWKLHGTGKSRRSGDAGPRPLIWQVAEDCNLLTGGGSADQIQIAPLNFKAPVRANKASCPTPANQRPRPSSTSLMRAAGS